jgi:hypothetical protein
MIGLAPSKGEETMESLAAFILRFWRAEKEVVEDWS